MDLTMMERVGDRWEKMEGSCSTGQSPPWAAVPVEEEEKEEEEEEEEEDDEEEVKNANIPKLTKITKFSKYCCSAHTKKC
jgi:hypothetical protein